jgi:predicted Zn-dependent peptidase
MTENHNSALPGPDDIQREVLPNGITLLTRSNFNSPSVVVSGYFEAGALFDPDEKLGLADFVTSALMRGTEKRSFDNRWAPASDLTPVCTNRGSTAGRWRRICPCSSIFSPRR